MEYLRGFGELRRDPAWMSKVGVASLLLVSTMCVPLVGQLVLTGWSALIVRRLAAGDTSGELPRLDFDFGWLGKLLGVGFKPFLVNFIWQMPVAVISVGFLGCMYAGFIATAISASEHHTHSSLGPIFPLLMMGGWLLLFPLMLALRLPAIMAVLRAELTDDLQAGLQFKEVLGMVKLVWKELLIGIVLLTLALIPLVLLGELACIVGVFPATIVGQIVSAHFIAQLYPLYLSRGGAPLTIASVTLDTGPAAAPPPPALPQAPAY